MSDVDSTWKTLVTALDEGTICTDAKVAPDDGSGSGQNRLICVYTHQSLCIVLVDLNSRENI